MKTHVCVDCKLDPPRTVRPASGGPRSKRCATHLRDFKKAQKKARHDAYVVKTYDLEPGEYDALLAFQDGTCAISGCRASGRARRLAVDHDHVTGRPRGLLCSPHNYQLLGVFADDLQDALDYLANPPMERMKREANRR